jgi:hypothetical protein
MVAAMLTLLQRRKKAPALTQELRYNISDERNLKKEFRSKNSGVRIKMMGI